MKQNREKQKLFVVTEGQYSNTNWYDCVIKGLYKEASKRNLQVCIRQENDLQDFPHRSIVVLLGSSLPFISSCINTCLKCDLRPLVAGFEIYQNNLKVSYVTINRRMAMAEMVRNLISCGANKIALFGVNSSIQTDMLRYEGWLNTCRAYGIPADETDVFYSDTGLKNCLNNFLSSYTRYDAVACTNDYHAVSLLAELVKMNISIPDDMMITGFGNTLLSRYTSPALTTVALNLHEVGIQVVELFRTLQKNPELLSCSATLNSQIITRETTKKPVIPLETKIIFPDNIGAAFEPTYEKDLKTVYSLENVISGLDEIDEKILRGLFNNLSYDALSESLYLSETAFKYRLQKLFHIAGVSSRQELTGVIAKYIPRYFDKQN